MEGDFVHPHGLYSLRCMAMNHRCYIGYTVYGAIPFIRTGYIRNVPGTAHRPFPTVRLGMPTSAPIVPITYNAISPVHRIHRLKAFTNQRNRRERPVCRSAAFRMQPVQINKTTFRYVIPTGAKRSGGIYASCNNNLRMVKLAA